MHGATCGTRPAPGAVLDCRGKGGGRLKRSLSLLRQRAARLTAACASSSSAFLRAASAASSASRASRRALPATASLISRACVVPRACDRGTGAPAGQSVSHKRHNNIFSRVLCAFACSKRARATHLGVGGTDGLLELATEFAVDGLFQRHLAKLAVLAADLLHLCLRAERGRLGGDWHREGGQRLQKGQRRPPAKGDARRTAETVEKISIKYFSLVPQRFSPASYSPLACASARSCRARWGATPRRALGRARGCSALPRRRVMLGCTLSTPSVSSRVQLTRFVRNWP